jgi:hypothetical protein
MLGLQIKCQRGPACPVDDQVYLSSRGSRSGGVDIGNDLRLVTAKASIGKDSCKAAFSCSIPAIDNRKRRSEFDGTSVRQSVDSANAVDAVKLQRLGENGGRPAGYIDRRVLSLFLLSESRLLRE